jgi:hypothetical protein
MMIRRTGSHIIAEVGRLPSPGDPDVHDAAAADCSDRGESLDSSVFVFDAGGSRFRNRRPHWVPIFHGKSGFARLMVVVGHSP